MHALRSALTLTLFMTISPSWADETTYWQCSAIDQNSQSWTSKHAYERTATNQALEACKQESPLPSSCSVSHEACERFRHGVSTRPSWQCTALDQEAKPWASNPYPQRDDAAMAAKAYCKERSASPDTCHLNFLTCINLNPVN